MLWAVIRILQGIERERGIDENGQNYGLYLQHGQHGQYLQNGQNGQIRHHGNTENPCLSDNKWNINVVTNSSIGKKDDHLFNDSTRLFLASYWSNELCLAVAEGLTMRTLKVL